ncbi:asparagine synthase (glutamine-hydrolyzing) [Magnetococcales bacterium HHB-1]
MCGIVGIVSFSQSNHLVNQDQLVAMRDIMAHRGPDGAGAWVNEQKRVGLGHRRLSIIDLSTAANQPMHSRDGRWHLIFNGEIYNHEEIRKELESLGVNDWQTSHSDTEMILLAFRQWGIDCIQKFRGMFAFAIWDATEERLWLVRDRIGIKPLYYSIYNGRLTFASEIKALLQDPELKKEVHESAFFHYLSFLTAPAPQTLFKGIKKLPGGSWLRLEKDGRMQIQRYWDVWDHVTPMTNHSEEEIAEQVLSELREAVKLRKVSDVPVGVFLSGGIDSSTNAALFSEGEKSRVKTFSIGYEGEYSSYQNELHFARQMAKEVNSEHFERRLVLEDLIRFMPEMVFLQDEPIADPVCVPVYYVSDLARKNDVIVCQVGEGSDELFWGYPTWKSMYHLQKMNEWPVPRFLKQMSLFALKSVKKNRSLHYEYLWRGAFKGSPPIFWSGANALTHQDKMLVLAPRLKEKFHDLTSWEAVKPIYQRYQEKAWQKHPINWMAYADLNLRLPELLLMRVDKMSMGVSLEGRVPFLDHRFVELAMSIPAEIKMKDGVLKHILKKSVRGVIPDSLIDRKKQGFGVPIYEWFFDRLGPVMRQELDDFCKKTDFLDPKGVQKLFDTGSGPGLWYLYNFALWWRTFIEGDASKPVAPLD